MSAAVPHVVVIAFPFASHAVKLFRLARALAAAAPAATFSFLSTAALLKEQQKKHEDTLVTNLRFVEVPDGLSPSSDGAPAVPPPHPMVRLKLFMAAAEAGTLREALETARASAGGGRVTCVVGDSFMWTAAKAAAEVEAPWVAVWTGGPSALLAHLRADALRDDVGDKATSRADELLTSHPGLGSYRVRDLLNGIVSGDMKSPIVSLFRRIAEHLPRAATAVAFNTFPGLLPDDLTAALAAELPECLPVGPFHLLPFPGNDDTVETSADPHGCLDWLNRHPARAVAYASFGTVVTVVAGNPEELRELAAGLESSGAPFLWSLPKESWPQLPPGFLDLERGKVVPWAPQAAVLRHASVGAFVTHAGWASVLEGVSAGVPMACRPFFTDQKMNAQLVARVWGFGTVLEEPMKREAVAEAVPLLLAGDQGIRMWEKMQEMQRMAASAFAPDGGSRKNLDKLVKIVCGEL
ncbi:anthocyanidin 3-O-glucosyltransferase-like [Triticum dicoccoides]|uniref:anthocyanidin 3-O-glucosyltransferase-like n=1 Tax=Triticum dicoccoides TaxID=85692 RepID=UPI00188F6B91|nr:anthocyanidin 3-O-glucosyltransferase-like [Triticum dicoccoides]